MSAILPGEVRRVLKKPCLATHPDGRVEIEWQLVGRVARLCPDRLGSDEAVETGSVASFGIAVEEEGREIGIRKAPRVQLLQVRGEVVYPLSVKELGRSAGATSTSWMRA
jgi:hypothetical protein